MGILATVGSFLGGILDRSRGGRPPSPATQQSGGGVAAYGGYVIGAEKNSKLVGVNRHQLYQQGIANTDSIASPLRALQWMVGDVDFEMEPAGAASVESAKPDSTSGKPPGGLRGEQPSGGKPPAGAGTDRPPPFGAKKPTVNAEKPPLRKASDPPSADVPKPTDPESAAAWMSDVLFHQMRTPLRQLVGCMVTYRPHGFDTHEWVGETRDDGTWGLKDIVQVPQTTITKWNLHERTKEVLGIVQQVPQSGEEVYIPRSRLVYLCDSANAQGDPAGMGLMRHCVEKIDRLRRFEQLEGFGYETELRGVPKARAPLAEMRALVAKGEWDEPDYNKAIEHVVTFLTNHIKTPSLGIVLDSEVYRDFGENSSPSSSAKKWDLELMTSSGAPHGDINVAIDRMGRELARVWSADGFHLGGGDGSHAMSKDKTQRFATLGNATAADIAEALNRDVIRPIWELNKFDPKIMPRLKPGRVDLDDVAAIATAMKDWAGAALEPDDPATNAFRRRLHLPAIPLEVAQRAADRAQAMQEAELQATQASTEATLNPPAKPAPAGGSAPPKGKK